MKTALLIFLSAACIGCSVSAKDACRSWVDSEAILSSYERCLSCAKLHGTKDIHAVRNCAFKRDIEDVK